MFQLLRDTQIDFMGVRKGVLLFSGAMVLASIVVLAVNGLNMGIEFTGGTEVQLKYADAPDLGAIRGALGSAGLSGYSVTSIGEPADHEVIVHVATTSAPKTQSTRGEGADTSQKDPTSIVIGALRGRDDSSHDLNVVSRAALREMLEGAPGVESGQAEVLAEAMLERRRDEAIFHSVAEAAAVPGMPDATMEWLTANATTGRFAVRSQSYIGPAIGSELQQKAGLAILWSLGGMLIYIWIRFQLRWGLAAVVALAHDTVITLGLFSIFGKEMSLAVVAAFLTLIGYSVNDTVVVFDRIRENMGRMAGRKLSDVINLSINQTLSRTVITSGLTFVVTLALLVFGGSVLNSFAFVLTAGIVVGTYSSIFVASPLVLIWARLKERNVVASASEPQARKVRAGATP